MDYTFSFKSKHVNIPWNKEYGGGNGGKQKSFFHSFFNL